jgi:hypothetical protein
VKRARASKNEVRFREAAQLQFHPRRRRHPARAACQDLTTGRFSQLRRSPDGAKRNPGLPLGGEVAPGFRSVHPGYASFVIRADYVVLAALALLIADVAAAQAAMRLCNAQPWRCRYSSGGRQYFYGAGSNRPIWSATSSTGAAWGCGATDGAARGRSWNFSRAMAHRAFATIIPASARTTRLRLVSPGRLVSNKIACPDGSSRQDKFMKIEIEYCGQ